MKNNLRVERAIFRVTQQQMAEMINVSRQTIVAIESEKYVPSTVLAMKIAKVCSKKVEDIFFLEDTD